MINTNKYRYKTVILLLMNIVIISFLNIYNKIATASTDVQDSYFEIVRRPQYVMVNYRNYKDQSIYATSVFHPQADFSTDIFHEKYMLKVDFLKVNNQTQIKTHFYNILNAQADYFIAFMYLKNDLGSHLSQQKRWQQAAYHLNQSKLDGAKLQLARMYLKSQVNQSPDQDEDFLIAQQLLKKITTPKMRSKAQFDLGKYHVRSSICNPAMEEQYTAMAQQCFKQSALPEARLWSVALKAKAFIKSDQKSQSDCENIQETCENLFKTHVGNYAHAILGILCENGEGNDELENQELAEQIVFHYRTSNTPAAKFAYAMLLKKGLIDHPSDQNAQENFILQLLQESNIPKANIVLANQLRNPAINLEMNPYQRLHIAAKLYRQADTGSAHFSLASMRLNGEDTDDLPFKSRLMLAERSLELANRAGIDEAELCIESIYDYYNRLKPRDTRGVVYNKSVSNLLRFVLKNKPSIQRLLKHDPIFTKNDMYVHGQPQDISMRVIKSFINGQPTCIFDIHTDQGLHGLQQYMKKTLVELTSHDQQLSFDDLLSSWL